MNGKYAKRLLRWAYALYYDSPEVRKTLKMCVYKQVPEEPIKNDVWCLCPDCREIVDSDYNFCKDCGQALKWPEVKK